MQALIGLAGVVIGAALAPLLDLVRQRRTDRRAWQRDLRELAAALIAHSGDQLVAQTDSDPSASTSATAANAARWRIQLIAPEVIAQAAEEYAAATEVLRKRLLAVGSWDGEHIATEWDAWQTATRALITATRPHLGLAPRR
jgi:hypothetical protein